MVVLDYISSCSGLLYPVAEIASALKKLDIIVIVDGAHAPGQVSQPGQFGPNFLCNQRPFVTRQRLKAVVVVAIKRKTLLIPTQPGINWTTQKF